MCRWEEGEAGCMLDAFLRSQKGCSCRQSTYCGSHGHSMLVWVCTRSHRTRHFLGVERIASKSWSTLPVVGPVHRFQLCTA